MKQQPPLSHSIPNTTEMSEQEQMVTLQKALQNAKAGNKAEAAKLCAEICNRVKLGDLAFMASKLWVSVDDLNNAAWNALGNMAMGMDHVGQAIKAYDRSLELKPNAYDTLSNLSNAWHKKGDLQKARRYVEDAMKAYGKIHPVIKQSYIRILSDQGFEKKAMEEAKALVKAFPDHAGANHILGKTYLDNADIDEAIVCLEKSAHIEPNDPFHYYNLGIAYDVKGDHDNSQESFQKVIDLFNIKDPYGRGFEWERRYSQGMVAERNNDKRFKTPQAAAFDDVAVDGKHLIEKREVCSHGALIHMKDVETPTNEWPILFDGKAVLDLFLLTDRNFLVGFRSNGQIVLDARFPEVTIDEPCILLPGSTNYYHWVIDYLPRLEIIEACEDLKDLPIVLNPNIKDFQRKALDMLGYGDRRIIEVGKRNYVTFKDVYIPHLKGRKYTPSGIPDLAEPIVNTEMIAWIRKAFADYMTPQDRFPKRVFISRQEAISRRCKNEDELFDIAKEYGFEKVKNEDLSYEEQIAMYSGIEAVMGVHGAGFTNMVFAPKGSSLIEIFPQGANPQFFEKLCRLAGHKNFRVEGPRISYNKMQNGAFHDFEVDAKEFREFMKTWAEDHA